MLGQNLLPSGDTGLGQGGHHTESALSRPLLPALMHLYLLPRISLRALDTFTPGQVCLHMPSFRWLYGLT